MKKTYSVNIQTKLTTSEEVFDDKGNAVLDKDGNPTYLKTINQANIYIRADDVIVDQYIGHKPIGQNGLLEFIKNNRLTRTDLDDETRRVSQVLLNALTDFSQDPSKTDYWYNEVVDIPDPVVNVPADKASVVSVTQVPPVLLKSPNLFNKAMSFLKIK